MPCHPTPSLSLPLHSINHALGRDNHLLLVTSQRLVSIMSPIASGSQFDAAALARRQALQGSSGPAALVKNFRVFSIACFACLGGLLYGYNQGVFSGVLTMTSFQNREF